MGDYLLNLRELHHHQHGPNSVADFEPQIGHIVLIHDNVPRGLWKMGRIITLPESRDGQVRSAAVQLSNGHTITRPLSALYPLEADVASSIIMGTSSTPVSQVVSSEPAVKRPHRQAAKAARECIFEWLQSLL